MCRGEGGSGRLFIHGSNNMCAQGCLLSLCLDTSCFVLPLGTFRAFFQHIICPDIICSNQANYTETLIPT